MGVVHVAASKHLFRSCFPRLAGKQDSWGVVPPRNVRGEHIIEKFGVISVNRVGCPNKWRILDRDNRLCTAKKPTKG